MCSPIQLNIYAQVTYSADVHFLYNNFFNITVVNKSFINVMFHSAVQFSEIQAAFFQTEQHGPPKKKKKKNCSILCGSTHPDHSPRWSGLSPRPYQLPEIPLLTLCKFKRVEEYLISLVGTMEYFSFLQFLNILIKCSLLL